MKIKKTRQLTTVLILAMGMALRVGAQNYLAPHWINSSGQNGATVLNTNGVFVTDYKGRNDFIVTPINPNSVQLYTDIFGGSSAGNNPWYVTNFLGVTTNGTGDGTRGDVENLEMTYSETGTLQFDFLIPLTPQDRILLIDVDGPEAYTLAAYRKDGTNYTQVSFVGWNAQNFSGTTAVIPDSRWPLWTPASGRLVSGTSGNLDEELFVLAPNQSVNRLVITKTAGASWSTDITFFSVTAPLTIQQYDASHVKLTWTNALVYLQSAPTVTSPFTNIPGATNPWITQIIPPQRYFRLYPQ